MKKVFLLFIVAGSLAACNNSSETTENKKDSIDSVAGQKKEIVDSSAQAKKDAIDSNASAKKATLDKMDSLNKKDSVKKK